MIFFWKSRILFRNNWFLLWRRYWILLRNYYRILFWDNRFFFWNDWILIRNYWIWLWRRWALLGNNRIFMTILFWTFLFYRLILRTLLDRDLRFIFLLNKGKLIDINHVYLIWRLSIQENVRLQTLVDLIDFLNGDFKNLW